MSGTSVDFVPMVLFVESHALVKQTQPDSMPLAQDKEKAEKGERIAENVRYGEAISEHGFGGETTGISGSVNQGMRQVTESADLF